MAVPKYCFTWQKRSDTNKCNMMPKYCSYFECKSLICDYFTICIKHSFKSLDKKIIRHDTTKGQSFTLIWNPALHEHEHRQHSVLCYVQQQHILLGSFGWCPANTWKWQAWTTLFGVLLSCSMSLQGQCRGHGHILPCLPIHNHSSGSQLILQRLLNK